MTDTFIKKNEREIIELGSYPQSKVEDPVLAFKLSEMTGKRPKRANSYLWTSYGYFINNDNKKDYMWYTDIELDGEKYRGVYFIFNRPSMLKGGTDEHSAQDSNGYKPTAIYWFKYEPLRWEVLEKNERWAYVASEKIIDSQDYSHTDKALNGEEGANVWAESSIRCWLNSCFIDTAFSEEEKKKILISEHAYRENSDEVNFSEKDRIFLLSLKDMLKVKYGYIWKENIYDKQRQKFATDYAECQGIHPDPASPEYYSDKYQGQRDWWILDPVNKDGNRFVDKFGGTRFSYAVGNTAVGVVPCMKISTGGYNGTAEDPDMLIIRYIKEGRKCLSEGNAEESYTYMLRAAELGSESAMFDIAGMLRHGTGVRKDEDEAVKWYKRVTEEGTEFAPYAMYNIGMIYFDRSKVDPQIDEDLMKQNQKEAYKWIDMAAQTGDPDALFRRGFMLENGIGVERNAEEARASYEMAEYNGSEDAKIKLASFNTD